jgi:WD40 repeat protein
MQSMKARFAASLGVRPTYLTEEGRVTRPRQYVRAPRGKSPILATVAAYPTALAWSAHGEILAVAKDTGEVDLLSPATGGSRRQIPAHDGPVQSIAWHPYRDVLLTTGRDGAARLWEPPFNEPLELIAPGAAWADHACWSATGERAAVAVGRQARSFVSGGPAAVTKVVASTIAGLAFTPGGRSLGVACHGGVSIFDPDTGRSIHKFDWRGSMISMAFSPDGRIVACGCQDNSVHYWWIASGQNTRMLGSPAQARSLSFRRDGRWLAAAGDATISLWSFDGMGPERRSPVQLVGHSALVTGLAYAPLADLLLSGSEDGSVAVWDPSKRTGPISLAWLTGKVTRVAWGADIAGQLLRWAAADEHGRVLIGEV